MDHVCHSCGRLIEADSLFCYRCGEIETALLGSARFAEADTAAGFPARYETKEEALARVERNADAAWYEAAREACLSVAQMRPTFTSDDIWKTLEWRGVATHEPKAMGAVLNGLARAGLIRKTGRYVQTTRPQAHKRDIAEWTLAE